MTNKKSYKVEPIKLGHSTIGFRNFSGEEGMYNKAGDRNFVIFLDDEVAHELEEKGWNIKWPKNQDANDPEDTRQPYLPVSLAFGKYPPKVVVISNGVATRLEEQDVSMLDWADIESLDAVIRPYEWEVSGNSGIKAYAKSLYFTLAVDEFAEKYNVL